MPAKSPPKVTNVYESTGAGVDAILSAAIADEPTPTPRATAVIEEALHAGPIAPISDSPGGLPASSTGGVGSPVLTDFAPGCTPRESAESLLTIIAAVLPSEDWQPESDEELQELVTAVERVFIYRGFNPQLPPELALIACVGKYTRKRMAKPAVAAKVGPFLAKLPIIGKLMGAPAVPAADSTVNAASGFDALPRMSPPSN